MLSKVCCYCFSIILIVSSPLLITAQEETETTYKKTAQPQQIHQVLAEGETLPDSRIKKPRHTRDEFHPWTPPGKLAEWEAERSKLQTQIAVSNGLWPLPPKHPLNATIHGKINRGDYTIEKVFFESHPGHYVCGNLYRPVHFTGKVPGILCPHGHWDQGRFYEAKLAEAESQLAQGAEKHLSGAHYPVQARMAQLARLGCTVFHYDMVGYADSKKVGHGKWFQTVETELRLENGMGLQTFNSIRSLDFLLSLPEVDPDRIGVTGSSGGGTQTFMLCALDDRPDVAFPAVMVSTGMQGGCVCENAAYLRQDINNVAIATLFAPKPMAMSGANDWTIEIETKGLPELKSIYALYGAADRVQAKTWPEFGHNYNNVARNMMYNWMINYLNLSESTPFIEEDFWPVPPTELSVFNEEYPLPENARTGEELAAYMTDYSNAQWDEMVNHPGNIYSEYQRIMEGASDVLLGSPLSQTNSSSHTRVDMELDDSEIGKIKYYKGLLKSDKTGAAIPYLFLTPENYRGEVILWLDETGKQHLFTEQGDLKENVRKTLKNGYAIASIDLFLTGESLQGKSFAELWQVDEDFADYTFCFNHPLLQHRVTDVLTIVNSFQQNKDIEKIHLTGKGHAAVVALLANGRMDQPDKLGTLKLDLDQFDFTQVKTYQDPAFLPGALKYGGLYHLGLLNAPFETITLYGVNEAGDAYPGFSEKYTHWLKSPATRKAKLSFNRQSGELTDQVWE
ncbi:MAG: hypothetical protein R3C11_21245 [Planctomycetaceae bacterium]